MHILIAYLRALIALLLGAVRIFCDAVMALIHLLRGELIVSQRGQDGCIEPPSSMRPRPDPYIYSQEWLQTRGIAYIWDNPDFALYDADGNMVDRMNLAPGRTYRVVVRIHNGSLLAAVGTTVLLEVLEFGMGGVVTTGLGTATVDVSALGAAETEFAWTTPANGGHNCLRARLSHPDDGNPLNNVGQHNTEVARPASPTRTSTFLLRNIAPGRRELRLEFDSYRLPRAPLHAHVRAQRNSPAYLRELRALNDRARHPVTPSLAMRITLQAQESAVGAIGRDPVSAVLDAGAVVTVLFEAEPPAPGEPGEIVNIHAFDGPTLVGGVTIYVDPREV